MESACFETPETNSLYPELQRGREFDHRGPSTERPNGQLPIHQVLILRLESRSAGIEYAVEAVTGKSDLVLDGI
jgi:hypothetical protein